MPSSPRLRLYRIIRPFLVLSQSFTDRLWCGQNEKWWIMGEAEIGDGRYARILRSLTGVQLLILDDWRLEPLDASARRDLYEILEERYGRRSTILTGQIPMDKWHAFIGDPTPSSTALYTTPIASISPARV